jgi:hypothetical protein
VYSKDSDHSVHDWALVTGAVKEHVIVLVLETVADASEMRSLAGSAVDRARMTDRAQGHMGLERHSHRDLRTGWLEERDRCATAMRWWGRARRIGRLARLLS